MSLPFLPTSGKKGGTLNAMAEILDRIQMYQIRLFLFFKFGSLTIKTLLEKKYKTKHNKAKRKKKKHQAQYCLGRKPVLNGPHLDKVNYCTMIAF